MKALLCGVMAVVFSVSAVFMTGASVAQANSKKALVVVKMCIRDRLYIVLIKLIKYRGEVNHIDLCFKKYSRFFITTRYFYSSFLFRKYFNLANESVLVKNFDGNYISFLYFFYFLC